LPWVQCFGTGSGEWYQTVNYPEDTPPAKSFINISFLPVNKIENKKFYRVRPKKSNAPTVIISRPGNPSIKKFLLPFIYKLDCKFCIPEMGRG
jgi:hypothetical protein